MENPITIGELYGLAHSRKHGEDGKVTLKFAKVNDEVADRIHKELDLDVHGFVHRMDEQFIRHADGGHDADGEWRKAQVPIVKSDYEKIERVVGYPDKIAIVGKTRQGLPIIQFKKQVNGHLLVLEAFHDGKKYLNFITMYKHMYGLKKGEAPLRNIAAFVSPSAKRPKRFCTMCRMPNAPTKAGLNRASINIIDHNILKIKPVRQFSRYNTPHDDARSGHTDSVCQKRRPGSRAAVGGAWYSHAGGTAHLFPAAI